MEGLIRLIIFAI